MSDKKTDPELLRDDGSVKFIGNKQSKFQPDLSGRRSYYNVVKHQKFAAPMKNKFLQDFNTQVVPAQLPGLENVIQKPPVEFVYLISEIGLYLLSEDNKRLTEE